MVMVRFYNTGYVNVVNYCFKSFLNAIKLLNHFYSQYIYIILVLIYFII